MRKDHGSLYAEVTDRIIADLEQGRLLWVQPWDSDEAAIGLPAQRWLTFRQARALGGYMRRGEEGETVCYLLAFTPGSGRRP